MPGNSKAKNPRGIEIDFNEEEHIYRSVLAEGRLTYVSVTQFVHSFSQPFDVETIAPLTARKRGMTVEAVKKEWEDNRIHAADFGTMIHETAEDIELGRRLRHSVDDFSTPEEEATFRICQAVIPKIKKRLKIEAVEKIVFDERLGLAGTVDLLAWSEAKKSWCIIDHKTNKKIEETNGYGDVMLPPVSHLDDCNFNVYSLQLSLYEYMLKRGGYIGATDKVARYILHMRGERFKLMELPDMRLEVRDMIIDSLSKSGGRVSGCVLES